MRFLLIYLLIITTIAPLTWATAEDEISNFEQIKIDRLKRIRKEMTGLESRVYLHKKELESEQDMVVRLKLESELLNYQREYDQKRFQFIETATGQQIKETGQSKVVKKDFLQTIQELLDPALKGIKRASERPRLIQKLKDDLSEIQGRLSSTNIAQEELQKLQKSDEHKDLRRSIKKSLQITKEIIKDLDIKKEDIQFRLLKLEKQEGSLFTVIGQMMLSFFKTKGKNLLLAFLIFIVVFWFLRKARAPFINVIMGRINKYSENPVRIHWVVRPIRVIYSVMTIIMSLLLGIMTLYALNDWVLVTFIIIMLGALVWSSKQYFPLFFEQSKIVLNLGAIREGERVVYQGLPWKIQNLGYYCRLVNPSLSGGILRINSKELLNSFSRPIGGSEPWFPTKLNDWVELSDGTFGKVVLQTPEQVSIKLIGEAIKHIKTHDFLALHPLNLSNDFGLEVILGVDYSHQNILFSKVIPTLKVEVMKLLREQFGEDQKHFKEYSVECNQAAASSLDIRFYIKCAGSLASKKQYLTRAIQGHFVDVCNRYGYVIPFQQLTVHMSKELQ
jgi:hypothetical protein